MKKTLLAAGILSAILLGYLAWHCTGSADGEVHLLPAGFTGIVVIRYNSAAGSERKYEDGRRIYAIPADGVLDTKFDVNTGTGPFPEFFYLAGGRRVPLGRNVHVTGLEVGASTSDSTGRSVRYLSYVVGGRQVTDSLLEARRRTNLADYRKQYR